MGKGSWAEQGCDLRRSLALTCSMLEREGRPGGQAWPVAFCNPRQSVTGCQQPRWGGGCNLPISPRPPKEQVFKKGIKCDLLASTFKRRGWVHSSSIKNYSGWARVLFIATIIPKMNWTLTIYMIGTLPFLQMRKLEFEESKGDDKCLQLMGGEVAGSRSLSMAELNTDSLIPGPLLLISILYDFQINSSRKVIKSIIDMVERRSPFSTRKRQEDSIQF